MRFTRTFASFPALRALALVSGLVCSLGSGAARGAPVAGYDIVGTGGAFASTGSATVGFRFSTDDTIFVSALGVFDRFSDGLATAHEIGLWTDDGALLASVTVGAGTAGTLAGGFRYADITDIELSAGTYRIGAQFFLGGDAFLTAPAMTAADGIVLLNPTTILAGFGAGVAFPSFSSAPQAAAANFLFAASPTSETVPEPSAVALMGLGVVAAGLSRRRRRSV